MKFSTDTVTILKNFATINQSINLKPGQRLKTISPQKTIIAIANIADTIPSNACIYDLSRFLSIYGLYTDPDIIFEEKHFTITQKDNRQRTKYVFADPSMIVSPPDKDFQLPSRDVEVDVKWGDMDSVRKAAGVLQLPEVAFVGENGSCYLRAIDSGNPTSDTFGIELGETKDTFRMIIKTEYLKLLPKDYRVAISAKGISMFDAGDICYYVSVDSKSTYKMKE